MQDTLFLCFLAFYAALLILDLVRPARSFARVPGWRFVGPLFFGIYFVVASFLASLWDGPLAAYRVIDATSLGTFWGALVGLLAVQLGNYVWHRSLHRNQFLWRYFHQMHHSAERLDVNGAFYFAPLDMAGFTLVSSLTLVMIVGVNADAAVIASTISLFLATFNHANVRTPRWLGYVIQRPENHALHHERGVHAYNYGDISLWDQLFGTFRNPETWEAEGGYFPGSTYRVGDMLLGRDIAADHEQKERRDALEVPALDATVRISQVG